MPSILREHTLYLDTLHYILFVLQELEKPPADDLYGLRIHSWVLVLAGKREVPENFFIEPLTGNSFSTTHDAFLGIESIWNNTNYWVNMQDCSNGCKVCLY